MNGIVNDSGARLVLPAIADLVYAAALKAELEQFLVNAGPVTVDASAVQRIATPCLQVLVAGGTSLTIAAPSAAFLETASTLGLKDVLRLA